ncbi:hypothetical protein ILUMI_23127 [Ignelater luminosus]|uniref:Uncharacterized protein n=1 Tax=Ignelater luminosus TaxID=2038154 RepID=A0A8K0FX28_IGNLU|nr:hypothetical protein ILUMI_23127 [Ignelater luminosus]
MSEELQYDSSLGGSQTLHSKVNLLQFTSARIKEIQAMKASLQETTSTKLIFQRLPKHMRRRVMSHNAKRLPRRLREIHLKQLQKSGLSTQLKKSTRRYRRRPANLLSEYARRQRTQTWLETHIWHAKRFHMINKWGYRLADRPCDKAFRACYRASTKHCLVQDISYFACVEISGPRETLINGFKTICDCTIGLSIGAKAFIRGNREGQTVLFRNTGDFKKAIGTVYFHWEPRYQEKVESECALWIWIHAAFYSEALDVLMDCFKLEIDNQNTEVYSNKLLHIVLRELKNNLNRFRLTGPLSTAVLRNTLQMVSLEDTNSVWFKHYLSDPSNLENYRRQCDYWKNIESVVASELSPHSIFCLIVNDPRHNLPKTKTKAVLEPPEVRNVEVPDNIAYGPIWNANVRSDVKNNKLSNAKFAELRSQLLVPGSSLEKVENVIPVMLIQRPGNRNNKYIGYGSGWDLIVPSGWGNTFWMSLVMWGGRAGGLRESNSIRFESGRNLFLEPDTQAGLKEEKEIQEACENRYFSLPPNKRPNYTTFGAIEPFRINWKRLVSEWDSMPADDCFVLREKKILAHIQELLASRTKHSKQLHYNKNCIVPIRLKLTTGGVIKRFARIYLADPSDLLTDKVLKEPLHKDPNKAIRKEVRSTHKKLLKRLRKQRKNAKKKQKMLTQNLKDLESYKEKMRKLWLPELNQSLRNLCSRQTIGYVTVGDFSFTQAGGCAVGYIALGAILALLSKPIKNRVLVRNIASRQYRLANLDIII